MGNIPSFAMHVIFRKGHFENIAYPSKKLTYPTWGKGNIIFKMDFSGDMLVPRRVISNHDRVIQPGQGRVQCLCHPFLMLSSDSAFLQTQHFSIFKPSQRGVFRGEIQTSKGRFEIRFTNQKTTKLGGELSIWRGHDYQN